MSGFWIQKQEKLPILNSDPISVGYGYNLKQAMGYMATYPYPTIRKIGPFII